MVRRLWDAFIVGKQMHSGKNAAVEGSGAFTSVSDSSRPARNASLLLESGVDLKLQGSHRDVKQSRFNGQAPSLIRAISAVLLPLGAFPFHSTLKPTEHLFSRTIMAQVAQKGEWSSHIVSDH